MADDYDSKFDNISAQSSDKFEGNFAESASPVFEMEGIEGELLSIGGFVTEDGHILGPTQGDVIAYVTNPDALKIDRMIKYISSILNQGITKAFWADNVIPPLRTAFRDIFSKQGPKDWKKNTKFTATLKTALGMKGQRRYTGGSLRQMHFTGAYRGSLVVTKAFWNRKGNVFVPLSEDESITRRFQEIYASAGVDPSNKWSKGFSWGVDLNYFTEHARKFWEGVRSHVGEDKPSKIEGNTRRARILRWLYQHDITTRAEINHFFQDQIDYGSSYPYFMEKGTERVLPDGKTFEVPARPVVGYFQTNNPITRAFYATVEKNFLKYLRKNLSKGARDQWYGGPGNITREGSPLQKFKQPFRQGEMAVGTGTITGTHDVTRDEVGESAVEKQIIEESQEDAFSLFERHEAGEALSPDQYIQVIRHSIDLASGGGLTVSQREMAGRLRIPEEGIEFDDE